MKLRKIIKYLILIIAILVVFTIGLSYAAFTTKITGVEVGETIYSSSGVMQIDYDGGPAINVPEMAPSNEPFATKTFTVTGTSSYDEEMLYHIILVMNINTFRDGALTYTLESTNTDENGEVAPPTLTQKGIKTGEGETFLGNGKFAPTESQNKTHTYTLKLYFPLVDGFDHSVDLNKEFSAKIDIREGHKALLLVDEILAQYGGADNIEEAPEGTFESVSGDTDNLMYKMEDDYGDSFYFRGAKAHLSNNLIFAEHQWKIVRINGDGSIRIIYNGTCPNNECSINSTGTQTQITKTAFNSTANDNKFVGYMYGTYSTNYETAHANDEDSTIKTVLDNWYEENIKGTRYEGYLSDTIFCADRTPHSGDGYGGVETYYASYNRLQTNKTPTLKCSRKEDRFTVIDTEKGNGALTYPIALLTADEASLAGLLQGTNSTSNYLYTGENQWLLSPARFSGGSAAPWYVNNDGTLYQLYHASSSRAARGVLNLNSNTEIIGTGITSDPYKVI